jgi:hypothetical protein
MPPIPMKCACCEVTNIEAKLQVSIQQCEVHSS